VGRLTRADIDNDPAERSLRRCEEATGERPRTCPWASLRDPFVIEVLDAHDWREKSQLVVKYPDRSVPDLVLWGVERFARALSSVAACDRRLDREEREREKRARDAAAPAAQAQRLRRR
jgi:hypothetical protein